MKLKIISVALVFVFVGSVAAVDAELKSQTHIDVAEIKATSDTKIMSQTGVREKAKRTSCGLKITSDTDTGESKATTVCTEDSLEHTDSWQATLRSSGDRSEYSPETIAVVINSERCPENRVCYQLTEGTVDINVQNQPPTTKESSPIYEEGAVGGENTLSRGTIEDSAVVVGYGEFSVSKRSARTGRNPQTGKEIQIAAKGSERAVANRILATVKSSECPEDGRERCVAEALKDSDVYKDLSAQGDVEILMTLTADPLAAPKDSSDDCDDTDSVIRPDRCRGGDVDGDGFDDAVETELLVRGPPSNFTDPFTGEGRPSLILDVGNGTSTVEIVKEEAKANPGFNSYKLNVEGETVAKANAYTSGPRSSSAASNAVFIRVTGPDGEPMKKAELVEAIASKSGLSKADSKKALDGFINTTASASIKELDKATPILYERSNSTNASMRGGIDKATPEMYEELARKDARIAELERRIQELEAGAEVNVSAKSSKQGDDSVVRKKPGRETYKSGNDADSDGDGISDADEDERAEPQRPGFVDRLLGSIFR